LSDFYYEKMSLPAYTITSQTARRFMQCATGMGGAFTDVASALAHLGFVQLDPLNVCGRMHDHILRTRVQGYAEHDLTGFLHRKTSRGAFEHHLPDSSNLAALPLDAWSHLQRTMQLRATTDSSWSGKLSSAEKRLAVNILARIKAEGRLSSQDIQSDRKAKTHAWDSTTLAKSALQKLFFHGRVLIAHRDGNRRFYDLPERVLPSDVLNADIPTKEETIIWLARLKLRQRRLAVLKASEANTLGEEAVPVVVREYPKLRLHLLRSDLAWLDRLESTAAERNEPVLIAPLDPIIYDRRITELVWGFHYRWEVYVPPAKRVRGYYALPLLHQHQLNGHADLKADRDGGKLLLLAHEGKGVRKAAKSLAKFLALGSVVEA
jgi:uncharacterized protein